MLLLLLWCIHGTRGGRVVLAQGRLGLARRVCVWGRLGRLLGRGRLDVGRGLLEGGRLDVGGGLLGCWRRGLHRKLVYKWGSGLTTTFKCQRFR